MTSRVLLLEPEQYLAMLGVPLEVSSEFPRGGQELILPEILALLSIYHARVLWLPFSLGPLAPAARNLGIKVIESYGSNESFDALYFGTPTLVNGKPLFPETAPPCPLSEPWSRSAERAVVRTLCRHAEFKGARLIISGLGSGDISLLDRIETMRMKGWSEPAEVARKCFSHFTDHVLITSRIIP